MSVVTSRKRSLSFTSSGLNQLIAVLNLYYPEEDSWHVAWCIDDTGYHLAWKADGPSMIPEGSWKHHALAGRHLRAIATSIIKWLRSLSAEEAVRLSGKSLSGSLTSGPDGFTVTSTTSADGEHEMLTVVPGWIEEVR